MVHTEQSHIASLETALVHESERRQRETRSLKDIHALRMAELHRSHEQQVG